MRFLLGFASAIYLDVLVVAYRSVIFYHWAYFLFWWGEALWWLWGSISICNNCFGNTKINMTEKVLRGTLHYAITKWPEFECLSCLFCTCSIFVTPPPANAQDFISVPFTYYRKSYVILWFHKYIQAKFHKQMLPRAKCSPCFPETNDINY